MRTRSTIPVASLLFFGLLSVLATYPTALRLSDFVVVPTDPLLQAWTLKWDVHALLSGPAGALQLWNANILFPYPNSLAFSEHLFAHVALLLPATLWGTPPLLAHNLGVLLTTALTGWGTYLLVSWLTRNRWAGLIAGTFFAVSSFRMGHLPQLNLLSTHWLPFTLLAMARFIKVRRARDLLLLILFTNLQFYSVINYIPMVGLALLVWTVALLVAYRASVSLSLIGRLSLFAAVTLGLNWPVFDRYRTMSQLMGVSRTLGDARMYSASLANYLSPMFNSWLYDRLLHLPTRVDSAFPGLLIIGLAGLGVWCWCRRGAGRYAALPCVALVIIVIAGFSLSLGANDEALGPAWASRLAPLLPYPYLFNSIPLLQGFRTPVRFSLLTTLGLAVLAGIGFSELLRRVPRVARHPALAAALGIAVIMAEHGVAPLSGTAVPFGGPVYSWLSTHTPADAVVMELPYYLHTEHTYPELGRVYQSAAHWRRVVNGTSGFKPPWLIKLGQVIANFPDADSFDLLRQLAVNYVVLHHDEYDAVAWNRLVGLLPGYLPSVDAIHSVGNDLILHLQPPTCRINAAQLRADARAFPTVTLANEGAATFVSDPRSISRVEAGGQSHQFLEPLFVLPGRSISFQVPADNLPDAAAWQLYLANVGLTLTSESVPAVAPERPSWPTSPWKPAQLSFADGAQLQALALTGSSQPCGELEVGLHWALPAYSGQLAQIELRDRFGRLVVENRQSLVPDSTGYSTFHTLPLDETLPAGQYQLRMRLFEGSGSEVAATGGAQAALPVVIRPEQVPTSQGPVLSAFANRVQLLAAHVAETTARPGDWLRFTLTWRSDAPPAADYTVFTQLLGPDGRPWGQQDNPPRGGWYPLSLWLTGEPVSDDYALRIDPAAPVGEYHLIVGWYASSNQERVGIITGAGQGGNHVEVASVTLASP